MTNIYHPRGEGSAFAVTSAPSPRPFGDLSMQSFKSSIRTTFVAALVAMIFMPAHARAQASPQYTIGANAGLVIPVSDLGDVTSSGYQVALTLGMRQALSPLSFRFEGSFTELPWSGTSDAKHRIYGIA